MGKRKVTEGEKSKEKVRLASCDVFLNFVILKVVNVVWGFFQQHAEVTYIDVTAYCEDWPYFFIFLKRLTYRKFLTIST